MLNKSSAFWVAGVALGISYIPTSSAQTDDAGTATLEEIVVTAEKRPETAQKTAISITAISGETLEKRGETELASILRNVPALQIEQTPQGGAVYVRGVGMNGDSNFIDPSVALSIDGVYTARSERLSTGLYDVSRAEVLRGPQGTIYGRNADGGAVNVITNAPIIGSYESKANLQVGNYNLYHLDVAQNIGISDNFALRVAGLREKRDGYFSNNGYASDVTGGRIKALYNVTDTWTLQAGLDYTRQKGDSTTTTATPGTLPLPQLYDDFDPADGWDRDPNDPWFVDSFHPADKIDYKFVTSSIQSDWVTDYGTLTVIPTWTRSARAVASNLVVGTYFGAIDTTVNRETQKTGEVRFASPETSDIKWVVGYYYLWSNNGGTGGTGWVDSNETYDDVSLYSSNTEGASPTVSKAPFGQITYPITDTFRVTAGLRHTSDTKSQASHVVSVAVPGYDSGRVVYDADFSATTYKFGVEYDVAAQSMLYAQVSTGYKAGGFDTSASPPKSYKPEYVKSYEIGSKNRFLDDTLQVNASVYYYDYTDLQVQYSFQGSLPIPDAYNPDGATAFTQYIANAGAGINKGAEVEVQWRFTNTDQVNLSAVYTNAHYGNFNHETDPDLTTSLDGAEMAFTPKEAVTLDYSHDWSVMGGTLTAQANTKWSSSYWGSVNNRGDRPYSYQKAYTRSDASLVYEAPSIWTASLWVKNIENKAQIQFGDFPLNRNVVSYPRTFGANLSLKFGT